jgi:hypothetical protein
VCQPDLPHRLEEIRRAPDTIPQIEIPSNGQRAAQPSPYRERCFGAFGLWVSVAGRAGPDRDDDDLYTTLGGAGSSSQLLRISKTNGSTLRHYFATARRSGS